MATPSNLYGLLGAVNTKDKWGHADKPAKASWRYRAVWAKAFGCAVTRFCQTYVSEDQNMRYSNWGIMIYFWECRGR
jgi:hypothetical protein